MLWLSSAVVKIAPIGSRTQSFHSRARLFAGLSIPGRDIGFMLSSAGASPGFRFGGEELKTIQQINITQQNF